MTKTTFDRLLYELDTGQAGITPVCASNSSSQARDSVISNQPRLPYYPSSTQPKSWIQKLVEL